MKHSEILRLLMKPADLGLNFEKKYLHVVLVMAKMVVNNDLDCHVRKPDCCLRTTNVQPANMCSLISTFGTWLSGKYKVKPVISRHSKEDPLI